MSFFEAIRSVFGKYCCFEGRACRSEYWFFTLFNIIVSFCISFLSSLLFGAGSTPGMLIAALWSLAVLLPGLGLCWRRLHDIGKSGASYFLGLIPLAGPFIILAYFCRDSEPGTNQYGPNPKEALQIGKNDTI